MNLGRGQIRGALFNFFVMKKCLSCIFRTLPSVSKITPKHGKYAEVLSKQGLFQTFFGCDSCTQMGALFKKCQKLSCFLYASVFLLCFSFQTLCCLFQKNDVSLMFPLPSCSTIGHVKFPKMLEIFKIFRKLHFFTFSQITLSLSCLALCLSILVLELATYISTYPH